MIRAREFYEIQRHVRRRRLLHIIMSVGTRVQAIYKSRTFHRRNINNNSKYILVNCWNTPIVYVGMLVLREGKSELNSNVIVE